MRGLSALPPLGAAAALIGLGAGVVLTLLGRRRVGRYLPTAASIGGARITAASIRSHHNAHGRKWGRR